MPAYQLAVVVDDAAMRITEVVRGADLLKSTARQILLFRALGLPVPAYYHCDLVRDPAGIRLAKRHDALSIRKLRELGWTAEQVRAASDSMIRETCGPCLRVGPGRQGPRSCGAELRRGAAPVTCVYNL